MLKNRPKKTAKNCRPPCPAPKSVARPVSRSSFYTRGGVRIRKILGFNFYPETRQHFPKNPGLMSLGCKNISGVVPYRHNFVL